MNITKSMAVLLLLVSVTFAQEKTTLSAFYQSIAAEKIGNYDEAINILSKNYSAEKNNYLYNLRLGWLYYVKGDYKTSLFYYKNAVRISSNSIESLLGITYPYSAAKNIDALKTIYKKILDKAPENYKANLNMGLLYFNQGDYLNSIIFLENVVKNYPSNYSTNLYLGWANYYVGGNKKAHAYFQSALMAVPNDPSALKGYNATK